MVVLCFRGIVNKGGTLQGDYNLRNIHTDLALPYPRREFLKKALNIYSGAKLWNCLSLEAKLAVSEYAFKININ